MDEMPDEHRMLLDSLEGILSKTQASTALWQELAELGVLGLTFPETAGGVGLGLPELLLFSQRLGGADVDVPYLASEGIAVPLLAECVDHDQVASLIEPIQRGTMTAAFADASGGGVLASRSADGFLLNGVLPARLDWTNADIRIVGARLHAAPALFLVSDNTPFDGLKVQNATLTQGALLAQGARAAELIGEAEARSRLLTCAMMVGAMERHLELTVEYLRTRRQFGRTLSEFQVLQHAAVDMFVEVETSRAMLNYGARMFVVPSDERALALDAVKLKINRAARFVGETGVQLHGGIGMTLEAPSGRLFARLTNAQVAHGDSRSCLNRLIASDASPALN